MGVVTPARAQAYDWTGLYAGLAVGGGWYHASTTVTAACAPGGYFCNAGAGAVNAAAIGTTASAPNSGGSFTAGGDLGYNYQFRTFVFGVEGGFGNLYLHGTKQFSATYPAAVAPAIKAGGKYNIATTFNTDWLALVRGRLAWAGIPGLLLFADGGLAVTDLKGSSTFADALGAGETASASANQVGWTVGGGVEVPITRNWMVKAEYLYLNLGSITANGTVVNPAFPALANGLTTAQSLAAHVGRLGIDYRF